MKYGYEGHIRELRSPARDDRTYLCWSISPEAKLSGCNEHTGALPIHEGERTGRGNFLLSFRAIELSAL